MIYTFEKFCNLDNLKIEIEQSNIVIALDSISGNLNETNVEFKAALSSQEETILDEILADHDASIPTSNQPQDVNLINSPSLNPFAVKIISEGSLFRRLHGKIYEMNDQVLNEVIFVIEYPHVKITGVEVVNCNALDQISFEVLDTELGAYTSIPNFKLNQFAFDVLLPKDYYKNECNYDADLYLGMQIKITYETSIAREVGINFMLNEVKQ